MSSAFALAAASLAGSSVPEGLVEMRISAQPLALRLHVVLLVPLVVALHLAGSHLNVFANLLPHHLLGDDLVADVGFEVLERHALLPGCLFQVLDGFQVVLLANFVQPLDQLRLAGDVQFLALGEPQLLVDQVAQQILVRVVEISCMVSLRCRPSWSSSSSARS